MSQKVLFFAGKVLFNKLEELFFFQEKQDLDQMLMMEKFFFNPSLKESPEGFKSLLNQIKNN